jgi:eukaryotic-like serine/threonine-protein kinase
VAVTRVALREQVIGTIWERNTLRLFRVFALRQGGRYAALRELYEETVRDAERRGDRYTESSVRRSGNGVWLAAGDPAQARADLERAAWAPPEARFHLQHWYELEARGELALYAGDVAEARRTVAAQLPAMRRAFLHRVQIVRAFHADLHARLLLAEAAQGGSDAEPLRKHAATLARRLAGERTAYLTVLADLLVATLSVQRGRPDDAIVRLRAVIARAAATGQSAHAAAARFRLASLVGGDDGAALRAEGLAVMDAEKVADPERMIALLTPGFTARATPG